MIKFVLFYAILTALLYAILMYGVPLVKENKWKYVKNALIALSISGMSGLIMFLVVELF